jgi:2-keto-4-pentenoate hydratase/2-oxohepta-3-ene-1,7-dioic acid hydratase in catechol pathway
VDDETYVDLSDVVQDFDEAFFGADGVERIRLIVEERTAAGQMSQLSGKRIGAPIARPHQILCIGLNYSDHAAGWCVTNDVSERAFQSERGGQWSKGKSAETFNPCGPWLVTPDEIEHVGALDMWLDVNGTRRQTGSTATMIFDPFFIVHYLSQFLVMEPGDLINTGTPPGVGMGADPPVLLRPGDVMELGIEGLGSQRQTVVAAR